ncbi:MAG: hypothetical protein ABIH26_03495 [Candidatus Eisenbacteria bacterium]
MWKCTQCGETVEEQFEACWKCQASRGDAPTLSAEELAEEPPGTSEAKVAQGFSRSAQGEKPEIHTISRGKALLENAFSHWGILFEDFHTSSMEFYASVEQALERRKVPRIKVTRVDIDESIPFSTGRVYLRVRRGEFTFDICAAPFGTGFFFSWWLSKGASWWWLNALFIATPFFLFMWATERHRALIAFLGVVAVGIAIPILRWMARRETYYKIDTMLMFQEAVRKAVNEVIDGLRTAKGLRALSAEEKKPIMRGFLGHK